MLAAQSSPVSGIVFAVAGLAASMVLVAGLAWASRRLLGLPVGALRALIAGLLGFAAAEILGRSLRAAQPGHLAAFITVVLGVPLIVAMIFLVAAEALVPSVAAAGGSRAWRAARAGAFTALFADQPDRGAARAGPYLRGRPLRPADAAGGRAALALSLRQALEEGGVTFTKLGQLLSTRRDLLPEEFISELAQLQDRAEPAPWEQVEQVITRSLGAPAGQVFAELQPEPAAAASIAQVHKARLRCGDGPDVEVAVKVQRPGIRATVEQDLDILQRMAVRLNVAPGGRVRSARPDWPGDSPPRCEKSSTSGWRHAIRRPSLPPGRASSGPPGAASRWCCPPCTSSCAPSTCSSSNGWTGSACAPQGN